MLELRPSCEHCNMSLPPASQLARICRFECTFCADCVETILGNVCPDCGGSFCPRPVRPVQEWRSGQTLGRFPASTTIRHRPVDPRAHALFATPIGSIPPHAR